jgi:single-strand DNA-binding protein
MYEAKGSMKWIGETQTFASGFTKREFVITTQHDKYPQDIKFEIVKDKCPILDQFAVGSDVTVFFDIRGNEYNGKYFVNLACWKLQAGSEDGAEPRAAQRSAPASRGTAPARQSEPTAADLRNESDFDDDDVPF